VLMGVFFFRYFALAFVEHRCFFFVIDLAWCVLCGGRGCII